MIKNNYNKNILLLKEKINFKSYFSNNDDIFEDELIFNKKRETLIPFRYVGNVMQNIIDEEKKHIARKE